MAAGAWRDCLLGVDQDLGVRDGDAIGKEIAELFLGPAVEDELGHEVQIGLLG